MVDRSMTRPFMPPRVKKRTKREPNERTNERRDKKTTRRDATHTRHTKHTHKKNHASVRIPRARARERRRRASPTEDVPAARIRRLVSQSGWKHTHHTPHGTEKERPTRTHKTTQNTHKKPSVSADSQRVPKPVAVGNTHTTHTTHTHTHTHTHTTHHTARRKRDLRALTKRHKTHTKNQASARIPSVFPSQWRLEIHTPHTHTHTHTPHTPHTPHGTKKERPTRTHKTTQNTTKRHKTKQKKLSVSADSQLVPKPVLMRPKQA